MSRSPSPARARFTITPWARAHPQGRLGDSGVVGELIAERYLLEACVASGSGGWIWRARDGSSGHLVAVKMLTMPANHGEEMQWSGLPVGKQLPDLLDHGTTLDGRRYLVFAWIPGTDLDRLVAQQPLGPHALAWVGAQVAAALADLHSLGVLHGDVQLRNIRIEHDSYMAQRAILLDLGLAVRVACAGPAVGSLYTLAPELAQGHPATYATDLYALGCVLHHAITGRPVFDGDPGEVLTQHQFAPRPPLPSSVPVALRSLVAELLAVDPARRPSSAADVATLMAWWLSGENARQASLLGLPLADLALSMGHSMPLPLGDDVTVGRDIEQAQLEDAIARLFAEQAGASAVVLHGAPGVGRTHLLQWMLGHAQTRGLVVRRGQEALDRAVADTATLMASTMAGMAKQFREAHVVRAARQLWTTAPTKPWMWVLDDAETLPPMYLDVLLDLLRTPDRVPVLVVLGWQDGEVVLPSGWASTDTALAPRMLQVPLTMLTEDAVHQWAQRVAGADPALAAEIAQLSGGHPATMVAVLRASRLHGLVQLRGERLRSIGALQVPVGDASLLDAALQCEWEGLLSAAGSGRAALRRGLQMLALAAEPVTMAALQAALGQAGRRLPTLLGLALQRRLVAATDGQLSIASNVWRRHIEAVQMESPTKIHGWLAAGLAKTGAASAQQAWHLWRAGKLARAWQVARPAIEAALATPDYAKAEVLLADAERFGTCSAGFTITEQIWVLARRAEVLLYLGQHAESAKRVAELRSKLRGPDSSPEVMVVAASALVTGVAALQFGGKLQQAADLATDDLAMFDLPVSARAELLLSLGPVFYFLAQHERCCETLLAAGKLYASMDDREGQSRAWLELAWEAATRRQTDEAEQWLTLVDYAGLRSTLHKLRYLYVQGMVLEAQGRYTEAENVLRAAASDLGHLGHRRGQAAALSLVGTTLRHQRRFDEAELVQSELIHVASASGDLSWLGTLLNNLASHRMADGRVADALVAARRAVQLTSQVPISAIYANATLAQVLLAMDEWAEAELAARQSLAANGVPPYVAWMADEMTRVLEEITARSHGGSN